jgi:hypothetical protein
MKPVLKILVSRYVYFTIIVALIVLGTSYFLPLKWRTPALPFIIPFFAVIGFGIHAGLLRMKEIRFARFVNAFMIASFVKLFLYLIVVVGYVLLNRADTLPFILSFLVLYIIFSVFEVVNFLALNNRNDDLPGKIKNE